MIASLPMYDWPELVNAHNNLWQFIREGFAEKGIDAPAKLQRGEDDRSNWISPNLLIGQTCGYPFATRLKNRVRYLATPVYRTEGCEGAYYSSAIIASIDSDFVLERLAGTRFAYNSNDSLSGYRAIKAMFGDPGVFFGSMQKSGGHRHSARIVASGKADVAAIDAVCWNFLQQHESETVRKLRVIGWTKLRPALPLITSLKSSETCLSLLRQVIEDVFQSRETAEIRQQLAIGGSRVLDEQDYHQLAAL